ncbi:MAG TPA: NUDIX domain-containing protein [Patescibacteria group bacterium]
MSLKVEYLDIVDEKDNIVTPHVPYEEVHAKHARHRVVHVMIFNSAGEFLLQLRSKDKSAFPNYWTFSAGGHVRHGESYEDALVRETKEEVGIDVSVGDFEFKGEGIFTDESGHKIYYHEYSFLYDGPIDEGENEEVEAVQFVDWATFEELVKDPQEKIHPELLEILKRHYGRSF